MPRYDPSGHVKFKVNKDNVTLAANLGKLRQIKNTGDYNVKTNINNLGFREAKSLQTSNFSDIFVVGDSFSFGWGVEVQERFSNQLDKLLPQNQVFNISIPTDLDGYDRLLNYAIQHGAQIRKLIVGVTMENDITYYSQSTTRLNHLPAKQQKFSLVGNFASLKAAKRALRDYSAAYFLATSIFHNNALLQDFMIDLGFIIPNEKGIPHINPSIDTIKSTVKRLKRLTHNFNALILVIPSRALWLGTTDQMNNARNVHDKFIDTLIKNNLPIVDMRNPMEVSKNPLKYHFKYDGHWNAYGHKLAAEELAKKIELLWN